jgi:ABC-type antimicrobial peptide transport system permease subunit
MLALLGIYGVLAYWVTLRRREFGVRIALGSDKSALIRLVLRQAALPVGLGCGAGLLFAAVAMHWVRSVFYEASVADPLAIGATLILIATTAGLAAVIPARRAASLDPMQALRME